MKRAIVASIQLSWNTQFQVLRKSILYLQIFMVHHSYVFCFFVWLVCFSKEANYKFQQRRNEYCGNIHKHWSGEVYSTMTVLAQNLTQQSVWKFCVGTVRIKKLDGCFSFWFCLLPMASVVLRKGKRQSFRKYRAHKK